MGLKPSDCAMIRGRESTAEFLLMFETALGITKELLHKEKLQDNLMSESSELKTNFKWVWTKYSSNLIQENYIDLIFPMFQRCAECL